MQEIKTDRFGLVKIDENKVIHFPEGLLGFPEHKDYVILEHQPGSPFCWLQSRDASDLAFVMANPFQIKSDYLEDLNPVERQFIENHNGGDVFVFALVTIPPGKAEKATINLLGPIVIDKDSLRGKQVILADSGYNHRHPFFVE